MHFTKKEIKDLLFAWVFITLIFTILLKGDLAETLLISAVAVGLGFLLHELAHKFVAESYGLKAHFVAFTKFMWVSVFLALIGIIFIAPGAVMVPHADKIRLGRIAVAGPLTNIALAIIFIVLNILYPMKLFSFGAYINSLLALFNMLPIFMLDGKKVLQWNKKVYYTVLAISVILFLS